MALTWKYRGFDYTSYYNGNFTNADSLTALVATGANAVETTLDWGINTSTNTVYADSSYTDPLTAEAAVIREAVSKGLTVMVKPHIDFLNAGNDPGYSVGEWRTYYNPGAAGSAGANSFFASYTTMMLQEAAVAAANGATMLCIGTELDQLAGPSYKHYWDTLISDIRAQDPSLKLTYAADWNDAASPWQYAGTGLPVGTGNIATQISFASELDYLGLDVYAPLSNSASPTLQQLINGWTQTPVNSGATAATYSVTGAQSLIQYFQSVATAVGKPLLFTEVGFQNASDAASAPAGTSTNVENDALQSLLYQSLFDAYSQSGDTAVAGAYLYNWDPNSSEVGTGSIAFSPQNLPALTAVDAAFAAPTVAGLGFAFSALDVEVAVPGVAIGVNSTGSVFSVTLTAGRGLLFATGGATVTGAGTGTLVVSGSLTTVNATLATLKYEGTTAANDTIQVSAKADGGPAGVANIAVSYDAAPPVLSFSAVGLVSGATVALSGAVSPANASRIVSYAVNGTTSSTTSTTNASGDFSAHLTLPTNTVAVVTASLTDALGATGTTPPLMIGVGDGLSATFSSSNGHVIDIFNATSVGDTVSGSNGYVIDYGSKATVSGGDDQIYTDSLAADVLTLTGTNNQADSVSGSGITVALNGAQANVIGGGDHVQFAGGTGDVVALSATGNVWDYVTAASGVTGTVNLSGALAQVTGGGQAVDFAAGSNSVQLFSTGGAWDIVTAATGVAGTTYLTGALAQVNGGGEWIYFWGGAGNAAQLVNTGGAWDLVNAASGSTGSVYLTGAQAQVYGGGDTINFWGGVGDAAQLLNTGSAWDVVNAASGSSGTVYLTSAWAQVNGGGESVDFWGGSGNTLHLANTGGAWDLVNAASGSSGTVFLTNAYGQISGGGDNVEFLGGTGNIAHLAYTNGAWDGVSAASGASGSVLLTSAQTQVSGGGFTVDFLGGTGDAVSLVNTGGTADTVANIGAVTGTVFLTNASAAIQGGGDTIDIYGGTGNAATLSGANESVILNLAAFGQDSVSGFGVSDSLSFAAADQGLLTVSQSNGNTTITRDANDVLTLVNYLGAVTLNYHA